MAQSAAAYYPRSRGLAAGLEQQCPDEGNIQQSPNPEGNQKTEALLPLESQFAPTIYLHPQKHSWSANPEAMQWGIGTT